jgi:hypothetical protein
VTGVVLVDPAPPALGRSPVARTGVAVNVAVARALRVLSPVRIARALFAIHSMPLYPEQLRLRTAASPGEYRRWIGVLSAGSPATPPGKSVPCYPPPLSFRSR